MIKCHTMEMNTYEKSFVFAYSLPHPNDIISSVSKEYIVVMHSKFIYELSSFKNQIGFPQYDGNDGYILIEYFFDQNDVNETSYIGCGHRSAPNTNFTFDTFTNNVLWNFLGHRALQKLNIP